MSDDPRQVLTLADAAARLHVSVKTVRRYIATGRLKGYRLGPTLLRVDAPSVDQLLKQLPTAAPRAADRRKASFAIDPALLDRLVAQAVADPGSWHRPTSTAADYLWPGDQAVTIEPKSL